MAEPIKQKLKIRNIISITVLNLIQIQNLDLSESFIRVSTFKKMSVVFLLQYNRKETIKSNISVISLFNG